MLGAEPARVGRLQPDQVPAVGHTDDREHRHLFEHPHQRRRWQGRDRVARAVLDHRNRLGRRHEPAADDFRHAADLRADRQLRTRSRRPPQRSGRQTLTFSIANKPAWAAFSTTTGRLSGTPSSAQTGTYLEHFASASSDGTSTVSLPTFAIVVSTTSSTGSATLSWTPPTRNTNGTTLTNLAGYRILYGTSPTSLTRTVQVANAGISRYVVENLASGSVVLQCAGLHTTGVESAASTTANTTVP